MTKLLLAVSLMLSSLAFAGMPAPSSTEKVSSVNTIRGGGTSTASSESLTTAEPKKESKTSARKVAPTSTRTK